MNRPAHTYARRGLAALAVSGLLTAGLTVATTSPAQSVPPDQCPAAVPVDQVADGDAVTGLTVTKGTTPETFTGSIEGVLEDGIAPGVDLIMADLHSTAIDKNGIWEGMSGSPVYDADGNLIGAVAYGLGEGPSTIAGITPASEMNKLRDDANLGDHVTPLPRVKVPRALARKLVASKAATSAQTASGLTQLKLPISVSGLSSSRLAKVAPKMNIKGSHVLAGPGGPASTQEFPITAGGNVAAAISYGTVTLAGLGTATLVCGPDGPGQTIIGFGHPMEYSGPSTKSLHGASALLIQDDSTGGSFKLANIGAPVGTVDQDRLTGIRGITGDLPPVAAITSTTHVADRTEQGTTDVNEQSVMPDVAFMHVAAIQDKALNRSGKGSGTATWTIAGTRANGDAFTMTRSDVFANSQDISTATADSVASDVDAIENNEDEIVKVNSVNVNSTLSDAYATYAIAKVEVRSFHRWTTAKESQPTAVHAGKVVPVRLTLTSREAAPKTVLVNVTVPSGANNKLGVLHVAGYGVSENSDDDFFDVAFGDFESGDSESSSTLPSAPSSSKFPKLIASLEAQPTQDQVDVRVKFHATGTAGKKIIKSTKTSSVVTGDAFFPIIGVR